MLVRTVDALRISNVLAVTVMFAMSRKGVNHHLIVVPFVYHPVLGEIGRTS